MENIYLTVILAVILYIKVYSYIQYYYFAQWTFKNLQNCTDPNVCILTGVFTMLWEPNVSKYYNTSKFFNLWDHKGEYFGHHKETSL